MLTTKKIDGKYRCSFCGRPLTYKDKPFPHYEHRGKCDHDNMWKMNAQRSYDTVDVVIKKNGKPIQLIDAVYNDHAIHFFSDPKKMAEKISIDNNCGFCSVWVFKVKNCEGTTVKSKEFFPNIDFSEKRNEVFFVCDGIYRVTGRTEDGYKIKEIPSLKKWIGKRHTKIKGDFTIPSKEQIKKYNNLKTRLLRAGIKREARFLAKDYEEYIKEAEDYF